MESPIILCVDDEPINLAILKHVLKKQFEVVTCQSGMNALEIMNNKHFTDVISDYHMPEMNGIEFINQAKQKHPHVSFHILSGYHDNEDIQTALKEKTIQNFFEKPFNKNQIISAVSSN